MSNSIDMVRSHSGAGAGFYARDSRVIYESKLIGMSELIGVRFASVKKVFLF